MRKSKYLQEVSHFKIDVDKHVIGLWKNKISINEELTSEIVGFLIGRAEPIFKIIYCDICKNKIIKGEEIDYMFASQKGINKKLHASCFEKENKSNL